MAHVEFMRAALRLARKGAGKTSPNPAVGAVIVKNGRVIASGYHRRAGWPHAEIEALKKTASPGGATLYVTLEPCCHFGKTPPCVDAIIRSGIKKVITGAPDPNPKVSGKGVRALKSAGIEIIEGVLESECAALNEHYNKYISTGVPFVTLKLASTLDGRIATASGESKWITGESARKYVHGLRAAHDAVLVGSRTLLKDDPELTVRLAKGKDPVRVVLDSGLKMTTSSRVFKGLREGRGRLIVFASKGASPGKAQTLRKAGAEVVIVPSSKNGLSVKAVLKELGKREITSVLVEGGGKVAASFVKAGLVDKFVMFYAAMILGGDGAPSIAAMGLKKLGTAPKMEIAKVSRAGRDLMIEAYPSKG